MKIRWTQLAVADLNNVYDYLAAENPSTAELRIGRIENGVAILARHPAAGRVGRIEESGELVVPGTPFIVVFRVRNVQVEILALIHRMRQWPDSL